MAKKAVKKAARKTSRNTSKKTKAVKKAVMKKASKAAKKVVRAKGKSFSPNIHEVNKLVELMVANDLCEIEIIDGQKRISLRRGSGVAADGEIPSASPAHPKALAPQASTGEPAPEALADDLLEIKSPMVGTFYSAPSPDSDPYASHGSFVSDETVVCIIEAMKVMNEIKAECSGTVVEVCVQNAQPVEFGQILYKVKPS